MLGIFLTIVSRKKVQTRLSMWRAELQFLIIGAESREPFFNINFRMSFFTRDVELGGTIYIYIYGPIKTLLNAMP